MSKHIYKITFNNLQDIYEIYAEHVFQGEMYGFVVVEGFLFNETSEIVVDPSAEKVKAEFGNVQRSFIPMHEIIRIDQVEKKGISKVSPVKESEKPSKISHLYTSAKDQPTR